MATQAKAPAEQPLLRTKLWVPERRPLIARDALIERLAGARGGRLTVIRAPAGWGKTTLLAAWASSPAEPRPFAWLSLEAADGHPARFWAYVVEALGALAPGLGAEALQLLAAPGVDVEREVLPVLLNEAAELDEPSVLALDDYHLVQSPEVHAQLRSFVEHLPEVLHLALATRSEPPLPLSRLRARRELTEVDAGVLRFSAAEAEALLNGVLGLSLTAGQVEALLDRTEGWAAGLYLAGLSLRDREDRSAFIDAFAGDDRHIVDYLGSEVLGGVPGDVRRFLLRTSVLDRLCAPLCDAVVGDGTAAALLDRLERSNLFVVPLDARRRWYRYHHLFGELLRLELEHAEPAAIAGLHRRAAGWYLEAGDADRGIRHLLEAGDREAAVELIAEHWPMWLLGRGEHGAIEAWLDALPPQTVRGDPRLCVAAVFVRHSTGRLDEVDAWIETGERALGPQSPPQVRADLAACRASQAVQIGDVTRSLEAAEAALAHGDTGSPFYTIADGVRAHALRWSGAHDAAVKAFADGYLRVSAERDQLLGVVSSHSSLALLHADAGRWAEAEHEASTAQDLTRHALSEHWMMTEAHVALALLHAHRGQRDASRAAADRALVLVRRGGVAGSRANTLLAVAGLRLGDGEAQEAERLVAEARGILAAAPDPGAMVLERLAAIERPLRAGDRAPAPPAPGGDDLSERELAVLRLLATELSQREIGDALYISLNTVKTHVRHIAEKLRASGRDETVARARECGLLP